MASGHERSTVPQETLGEDCGECIHGIPSGIICWECEYDYLRRDYDALEMTARMPRTALTTSPS